MDREKVNELVEMLHGAIGNDDVEMFFGNIDMIDTSLRRIAIALEELVVGQGTPRAALLLRLDASPDEPDPEALRAAYMSGLGL